MVNCSFALILDLISHCDDDYLHSVTWIRPFLAHPPGSSSTVDKDTMQMIFKKYPDS